MAGHVCIGCLTVPVLHYADLCVPCNQKAADANLKRIVEETAVQNREREMRIEELKQQLSCAHDLKQIRDIYKELSELGVAVVDHMGGIGGTSDDISDGEGVLSRRYRTQGELHVLACRLNELAINLKSIVERLNED